MNAHTPARLGRILVVAFLCAYAVFAIRRAWPSGNGDYFDFGAFWSSGKAVQMGQNPYSPAARLSLHDSRSAAETPNLDPPAALPFFALLARFDPLVAMRGLFVISGILYGLLLLGLRAYYRQRLGPVMLAWLVAFGPLASTLYLGQIYVPLAILTSVAWIALARQNRILAGVCIGALVAVKPNFAVWLAALALGGAWTVALVAGATLVLACLVPAALYGPSVYVEWARQAMSAQPIGTAGSGTLFSVAAILGHPEAGRVVGAVLAITALAAFAVWIRVRRPDPLRIGHRALLLSLLVSPVAWPGYFLILAPVFVERRWSVLSKVAAVAMLDPTPILLPLLLLTVDAFLVPRAVHPIITTRKLGRAIEAAALGTNAITTS